MNPIDDLKTLSSVDAWVWDQLIRAPHDRQSALKWPAFATVGEGGAPQARVVVLRAADRAGRTLDVYTDMRSAKVTELSQNPHTALLFFDQRHMVQVRVRGETRIISDGPQRDQVLAGMTARGRRDYATTRAPGTPLPDAGVSYEDQLANDHFCILRITVEAIDWLSLSRSGHRRAIIDYRAVPPAMDWRVP
ncbi:MAG: pyridoxamine 5'-phosphate oxidase family protein [Pseudomonadota bacterium]